MRKLLLAPLVLLALNVVGQAPAPTPAMPNPMMQQGPEFLVPVQMGTETLQEGKDTVKLTEQTLTEMKQAMAQPNYVVMLTSRGESGQVNLVATTPNYFLVKGTKGNSFDYVMFVKQRRPMMPMRPQRPMPTQQPANAQPAAPPAQQ